MKASVVTLNYNEVGEENLLEDYGKSKEELQAQSVIAEKIGAYKPPLSYFLKQPILRQNLIVMVIAWIAASLCYYEIGFQL
jgi:hypothetical protein